MSIVTAIAYLINQSQKTVFTNAQRHLMLNTLKIIPSSEREVSSTRHSLFSALKLACIKVMREKEMSLKLTEVRQKNNSNILSVVVTEPVTLICDILQSPLQLHRFVLEVDNDPFLLPSLE